MGKKRSPFVSNELAIRLPDLHPGQRQVAECPARFILVVAGRRWGKTHLGIYMALREALMGGRAWWVAPIYRQGQEAWIPLKNAAQNYLFALKPRIREREMSIHFQGTGGWIEVRSADSPQKMRGAGLSLAVLDEAAQMDESVFFEVILPALLDRNGRALLITTPYGSNWVKTLFDRITQGDLKGHPDWAAFRFRTEDNPFLPADALSSILAAYRVAAPTQDIYRQEILAEFVDFEGNPFARIADEARSVFEPRGPFVMGVDFGGNMDPTGLAVFDVGSNGFIYAEAIPPGRSLPVLLDEIVQRAEWNQVSLVCAEGNGLGTYLVGELRDRLTRKRIEFVDFWMTHENKMDIIRQLQFGFEAHGVRILSGLDELVEQLAAYRIYQRGRRVVLSAPYGEHDDLVIAAALAYYAASYWHHPIVY